MRLLAISAPEPLVNVAIPTLIDSGLDVEMENWRFVVAGPGVPKEDRDAIVSMLTQMRNTDRWRQVLETYSWEDRFLTGPDLDAYIANETRATAQLLEDLGLSAAGRSSATGPYLFPTIVAILLLATGAALLIQSLMSRRRSPVIAGAEFVADGGPEVEWRGFLLSAGLILAYLIALKIIGFLIATPLYLILQARIMGSRNLVRDAIVFVVFTVAAYLVFEQLLSIKVP